MKYLFALLFIFILFASSQSFACSVCGFGDEQSRGAYIFTTILLTFIPLGMVGSVVYFFYRKSKNQS